MCIHNGVSAPCAGVRITKLATFTIPVDMIKYPWSMKHLVASDDSSADSESHIHTIRF